MLNPRLETFYQKVVCEDFIVLYNFTNITKLPKFERAILSSTSKNFGESKISALQSFCAWRLTTTQKCINTRAHKSIALFQIRKETLLGLKVTLRRKSLFTFLDKILTFVFPKLIASSTRLRKKEEVLNVPFYVPPNQQKELRQHKNQSEAQNLVQIKHLISDFLKKKHSFHIRQNDSKSLRNAGQIFASRYKTKLCRISGDKTFCMISNNSSRFFPEISSLSVFFSSISGFSLSLSWAVGKKFFFKNLQQNLSFARKEKKIQRILLSAFGYPENF